MIYPFVRPRGHPFVPTCRMAERRAQTLSRMPLAAPAKPAQSVLDSGEHGATLSGKGPHHRKSPLTTGRRSYVVGRASFSLSHSAIILVISSPGIPGVRPM